MSDDYVPHDQAAEVAVLAACFQSPVATDRALKILSGRDFYSPAHEDVLDGIVGLRQAGKPVDHVTLGDWLRAMPDPQRGAALRLLPDLVTAMATPEEVEHHAEIVRACATRRRIIDTCTTYRQQAYSPDTNPRGLLEELGRDFTRLREQAVEDVDTTLLGELLDTEDPPYDWIIPGLMERQDRLMVTGFEGLGKSTFLRQLAVFPAAGLHPFRSNVSVPKIRTHYFEFENTPTQVRRALRALHAQAKSMGDDPSDRVAFDFRSRVNLLRDRDLSWLHRSLDATNPDLVIVGPLYRMFNKSINSDEDAAEVLEVLDGIRARGVALVIEAHSGHSKSASGRRDVRPRGSSALMGWPEFGYGIRPHKEVARAVELVGWRGDRDERDWPSELGRGGRYPWTDMRHHGDYQREDAA